MENLLVLIRVNHDIICHRAHCQAITVVSKDSLPVGRFINACSPTGPDMPCTIVRSRRWPALFPAVAIFPNQEFKSSNMRLGNGQPKRILDVCSKACLKYNARCRSALKALKLEHSPHTCSLKRDPESQENAISLEESSKRN